MEDKEVVAHQADDDYGESDDISLTKRIESIEENASQQKEMKESKYPVKHQPRQ